jgi:AcrR family transcriptional regulator
MAARTAGTEMRADARRNRENLVIVARTVFAQEGTGASLRDVARRAGVGIGTLYRHFPTRDALLEAVLSEGLQAIHAAADGSLDSPTPGAALATWLRDVSVRSGAWRGLPGTVIKALHDEKSELHPTCMAMQDAATKLLARAQHAGDVRADVDAEDLFTAAIAAGWVAEHGDPQRADRILALLTAGLGGPQP